MFWGHAWITQLYNDEMTAGCGTNPLRFCPLDTYTIAHAAVFGLRINKGSAFTPPSASGIFDDVDPSSWYAPWVEEAYRQELILACDLEMKRICPEDEFKRDHAAYMLVQALELDSNP